MKWISVKDKKPDTDCLCLVINVRGWMTNTLAIYHLNGDVFVEYGPGKYNSLPLDVTHYLEIPKCPTK